MVRHAPTTDEERIRRLRHEIEALGKRCEALEWTVKEYDKLFDEVKAILSEG